MDKLGFTRPVSNAEGNVERRLLIGHFASHLTGACLGRRIIVRAIYLQRLAHQGREA